MKLLFDENLSPTLPTTLTTEFPGSVHVRDVSLKGADDGAIWQYAVAHQFILVSKDDDFRELSVLRGAPPKVIILRLGNCRTADVAQILTAEVSRISLFDADANASILELP